jgi:hypothetical protein
VREIVIFAAWLASLILVIVGAVGLMWLAVSA